MGLLVCCRVERERSLFGELGLLLRGTVFRSVVGVIGIIEYYSVVCCSNVCFR